MSDWYFYELLVRGYDLNDSSSTLAYSVTLRNRVTKEQLVCNEQGAADMGFTLKNVIKEINLQSLQTIDNLNAVIVRQAELPLEE